MVEATGRGRCLDGPCVATVGRITWDWSAQVFPELLARGAYPRLAVLDARCDVLARPVCDGATELTAAALLIGFARTIQVVLTDAQVIHTIVNAIAGLLDGAGASVAANASDFGSIGI